MAGGLRPVTIAPINRGCVNKVIFEFKDEAGNWINKTGKTLYLTAKTKPWDDVGDDSTAVFKKTTTTSASEPGRAVFTLTPDDSYLDPTQEYFCDVVEVDTATGLNPNRLFIGSFFVIGGANNEQAGGNNG